ncbi:hypothetical protein PHYBLDRAFT_159828 [Phycomyces blakesleeanus NRRL 1555(-)]|uniref:3'-5' exonuclease n=1 Tax=Phycomyces blakesleeanus (strain ATCC 8743b / DSM 1359 / FGSC 10004 / NBRC 33097 / NRRL 1555) TaxID=763407 RepID=A0A167L655_PHYB8|nr:hypothetical protein PHYBLDRAFT_159828 [Phycomyces blakesleeanus NRRL 1555(-)]OAD69685.1 hypothetical protein PHYBLDRAFT_159828 [Phycomyces blakesleeanus NRRL 1555(-)]|eukprot:XP_018287725.1 hypothetical protein PHYBLDRAFT_159828 [Phycomyces blakesleeanus NRRL 1555(-)]
MSEVVKKTRSIPVYLKKRGIPPSEQNIPQETTVIESLDATSSITTIKRKDSYTEFLNTLPTLQHPSTYRVECVSTSLDTNRLMCELFSKSTMFGLDMEWAPTFVKGRGENKTALVQICDAKSILLIQLSQTKEIPIELGSFLKSRTKLKAGVNIRNDGRKLLRDYGVFTNGLVELDVMASTSQSPKLDITHRRSLQALTGMFLGQHMPKGKVRMSRWDQRVLTPIQQRYAANDAYASYKIYEILSGLHEKLPRKVKLDICHLEDEMKDFQPQKRARLSNTYTYNDKQSIKKPYEKGQPLEPRKTLSPRSTTTIVKKAESKQDSV